jgi:phage terminase small subunit
MRPTKVQQRYELFAREYVLDLNATRAAIAAGYSESTAPSKGSQLLTNGKVRKIVDGLLSKRASRLEVTGERILEELAKLAFFDIRKLFNADGSLKAIVELDDGTASAIAGIEYEKLYEHFAQGKARDIGNTTKVKILPKTEALKMLGQYRKLFTEKVELSGAVSIADLIQERRRAVA